MSARGWIRSHRLLAFVCIAFGWTWSWDAIFFVLGWWGTIPVTVPRVWGPAIAAFVVIWASEIPLRRWIRRRLDWRVAPVFLMLAVLIPLFITNVQPVVEAIGGGSVVFELPGIRTGSTAPEEIPLIIGLFFVTIFVQTFLLGGTEEIGWRGVVQPRLQQQMSVFTAGLVIGVVWWAWHLPLVFTDATGPSLEPAAFIAYTTFVLGSSTVLGAFVNVTEGKVLPVMLMHGSVNLGAFLSADGGLLAGSPLIPILVGSGLWWVIAGLLVARYGLPMTPADRTVRAIDETDL